MSTSSSTTTASISIDDAVDRILRLCHGDSGPTRHCLLSIVSKLGSDSSLSEPAGDYFDFIYRHAGHGIAIVDTHGRIQRANASYANIVGRSQQDLLARSIIDMTHPDDRSKSKAAMQRLLSTNTTDIQLQKRYLKPDGEVVWAFVSARALSRDGAPPTELIAVIQDITEVRQTRQALAQNEHLLHIAGRVARIGGWIVESDGQGNATDLVWSDEMAIIHGHPPGYSPDLPTAIDFYRPEYHAMIVEQIEASLNEGAALDFEAPIITASGEQRWIHAVGEVVYDDQGAIQRMQGALQDITERRLLEQRLLRTRRLESIGTLAGGIAHDLNNLLTPILMSIRYLQMTAADDDQLDSLDIISDCARRSADLVRQVLTFARGSEGEKSLIDPRVILDEVQHIVVDSLPDEINFHLLADPDLGTLCANSTQLHQVLLNLCLNARDAMVDGGDLTLVATTDDDPSQSASRLLCLEVHDTGCGIRDEDRQRIFDPFYTTKSEGQGTGLGLSTSLSVVEGHGGTLRVDSTPGEGSSFIVELPLSDAPAQPSAPSPDTSLPSAPLSVKRLLFVDNDESIRTMASRVLSREGYQVVCADDGAMALTEFAADDQGFDILITDITMPIMDGAALIQALRRLEPDLPIITTGDLPDERQRLRALSIAVDHRLAKPFDADALLRALATIGARNS